MHDTRNLILKASTVYEIVLTTRTPLEETTPSISFSKVESTPDSTSLNVVPVE